MMTNFNKISLTFTVVIFQSDVFVSLQTFLPNLLASIPVRNCLTGKTDPDRIIESSAFTTRYCRPKENFADPTAAWGLRLPNATNGGHFPRSSLKLTMPSAVHLPHGLLEGILVR